MLVGQKASSRWEGEGDRQREAAGTGGQAGRSCCLQDERYYCWKCWDVVGEYLCPLKATLYHTAAGLALVAFDEVDGWDTDKLVEGRDCLWKGPC